MDYEQFVPAIKEKMELFLNEGMTVSIHTTLKNNDRKRVGLTICNESLNISPTIYLEEYFLQYQRGFALDEIAECIWQIYEDVKNEHPQNVEEIKSYKKMRSKIVCKLVCAQKNEEYLETVPYLSFLDFAVTYYILFEFHEKGLSTIPITKELQTYWNVSVQDLHKLAIENGPEILPATFKPMNMVIEELLGHDCTNMLFEEDVMFVLTNDIRNYGASCLLYPGILEQIAGQLDENFYLLPSSIHEWIIVPESQCPSEEMLLDTVTEMNATQMDPEEILLDKIYYYDSQAKLIFNRP
jgi:hypothetical protein